MAPDAYLPERAIVLDTNAFPVGPRAFRKPLLSLESLRALAEDAEAEGVEIWLPEVVVWELADHAAEYYAQQYAPWSATARRLGGTGLVIAVPTELTASEIHEQTAAAVGSVPNVRVVACRAESARDGLRDQILQTGPATRDRGVKSGAADSTWVRDIVDEANGATGFHLVTADSDPAALFRRLGLRPPTVHTSLRHLRTALFLYDETRVQHAIIEILDFLNDEDMWDPRIQMPDPELDAVMASQFPPGVSQIEAFAVLPFKVLGVTDVRITKMRGTVSARVVLAATLELGAWTSSAAGVLERTFSATYDGGVLAADFVFDRYDGELSGASADGTVIAYGRHERYATAEDAKREVVQRLVDLVPDVATIDDPGSTGGEFVITTTIPDIEMTMRETATGWVLTILDRTDSSKCVVSCGYDDLGLVEENREGDRWELEPYVVSAVPDDASLGRPTWAANAFLLDRIQRSSAVM
jgi:hypothetical protein